MRAYMPFIVSGVTSGAVYALAALGLVLTYRTSGVFNFGHGAIGMFATYMFYSFRQHLPTALAMALAIGVVAPILGLIIAAVSSAAWRAPPRPPMSWRHSVCW